ncbi:MAG: UDP-N-acetylglucosamine--N-acetylmuramyl-(pentapeptide) pyrophosphoryl-undecaprenol [Candidatus Saccharibacteria bacterium]|nr:UDP-N-acetylglucosamine--N-acetylmuramyl-(pentapeptide) pyrophosphoryl-undecaprenol [Candidatus Saccharibacteria bacterium]
MTGGGSGGHITPILAVAAELKRLQPDVTIVYIGQTGDALADIPASDPNIDASYSVRAGKFRRYHGETWRLFFDLPTMFLNVRDAFYTLIGIAQSYRLMRQLKPVIIFTRGGFVSVPVAIGGRFNHVPYITHDSDALPSLANRLIAKHAVLHAVALPEDVYPYPRDKTITTGIPINTHNSLVTPAARVAFRQTIGLEQFSRVLLVTGGGNGAHALNQAVLLGVPAILSANPDCAIVHIAGRSLAEQLSQDYDALLSPADRTRVVVKDFVTDFYKYSGAADVIIARAGATNLAEFAVQAKACIIIPPRQLIWAVKNSEALAERGAVVALSDAQLAADREILPQTVNELLGDDIRRQALAEALHGFARPDAAKRLAMVLLEQAKK